MNLSQAMSNIGHERDIYMIRSRARRTSLLRRRAEALNGVLWALGTSRLNLDRERGLYGIAADPRVIRQLAAELARHCSCDADVLAILQGESYT